MITPAVERAQIAAYGRARVPPERTGVVQALGPEEISFIAARDSFYLATVSENGWPYVQHRGGPKGFVRVVGDSRLAFGDYTGNHQLLSTGNVKALGRVALFLMDYPARERFKIIGHARVLSVAEAGDLASQLSAPPGVRIERVFSIEVVGFDWNCSKYITPRFTADEVAEATQPLRDRIAELEAQLLTRSSS
jgi:predicted pyridoxine 5'-phosphate oxidase superfamily flavin-nucleotide-binding protein